MKRFGSKVLTNFTDYFSVYSTPKEVKVPSKFLACTYFFLMVFVFCAYIDSLHLDLRKMYQKECPVQGSIVTKVKGILNTEDIPDTNFQIPKPEIYKHVWDENDLIYPSSGGDVSEGSFIAVTNLIVTANQTKGICPGSSDGFGSKCKYDGNCTKGYNHRKSCGIQTGQCWIPTGTCLVKTWCPVEKNIFPLQGKQALLKDVDKFTVMIKNHVEFPECGKEIRRSNILDSVTEKDLKHCTYDPQNDPTCPIFAIGDIVEWSGYNFSDVALRGAIFRVKANWDCDFDWLASSQNCFPTYTFDRLDNPKANLSRGWNFRAVYYYEENRRTLVKFYGLKILIQFGGKGRRFDLFYFVMTVGATMGLFCIAPLACNRLFELFSLLKSLSPFSECFGDYSVKAKYDDPAELVLSNSPSIQLINYYKQPKVLEDLDKKETSIYF